MQILDLNQGPIGAAWRDNTVGALYELAKRAPGQPLELQIGTERLVLLQDAARIRHVLRNPAGKYVKNFGAFTGFFGLSRLTADGERWKYLQGLSQQHIVAARPAAVVTASSQSFSRAVDELLAQHDARTGVVVDGSLDRATARVISEVALGNHGIDVDNIIGDFREVLRTGSRRSWAIGGLQVPESRQQFDNYDAARGRIAAAIRGALGSSERSQLVRDIAAGEANGADPVAEISTLLFAGFDTTAAGLGWALFLLATAPDLQRSLRDELRRVVGTGPVTLEQLDELSAMRAFQNEVLRIFPPVPMLGRTAVGADSVDGIEIGEGRKVVVSVIGMHHDPRHFPSPARINLKRAEQRPAPTTAPFGDGKRICVGLKIANTELTTALAVLLSRLEFGLADRSRLEFDFVGSLRRRNGHRLFVREVAA